MACESQMAAMNAAQSTYNNMVSNQSYTVSSGDTFSSIASSFGVSVAQLSSLNPSVQNPNALSPGQNLTIYTSAQISSAQQDSQNAAAELTACIMSMG